jgi:hypothetical protein
MGLIKGTTVILYDRIETGEDEFHRKTYDETPIEVDNVLIAPSSATDVINETNLEGKKAVYTLAIPKGDEHVWEDRKVEFFGETWHTFGIPLKGMDELIPLGWNMKVMVERYG